MEWQNLTKVGAANQPLARWKHTATVFDNTNILLFGGFHTQDHRLNDLWLFDAFSFSWKQPNAEHNMEASSPSQLSYNAWANVPAPRASHSATLIGDNLYIFGGYGGLGYSRRDLDDLYSLNVRTWLWAKISAKGTPPEKRSGHQGCAIEKQLFVFGGSNSSVQFQDLHVLDTDIEPPTWSKMTSGLEVCTWNQAACSVIAIPTWKIFTFGGCTGMLTDQNRQGELVDQTHILDTGILRWTQPKIDGKPPSSRSDTCMSYDSKGSRLIVYGGWSDRWHDDLYTLDVGNIVGPPYAITDMIPKLGPVTGGTHIIIVGIDFVNTNDVIIRFGNSRNSIDIQGVFVTQTKITCVSPDFQKFPPGKVDVRVALDGDSFTTTYQRFSFFSVTNSLNCIMYGPGLLNGCALNDEVSFVIQARSDNNEARTTGGDEYNVSIFLLPDNAEDEPLRVTGIHVKDLDDGRYIVTYIAKYAGKYEIKCDFMGTFGGHAGPVRGSGLVVQFDTKAPRDNNLMSGQLVIKSLKADVTHLGKFTEDLINSIFVRVKDDSWSNEQHIKVLMSVKEALLRAEDASVETTLLVDRSECIVNFLKEQDVVLPGLEDALSTGKTAWEKILREAPQILNKITPMMRSHSSKIRGDVAAYEAHVTNYKKELGDAEFYLYITGPLVAADLLDSAEDNHKEQIGVCDKMVHIANVFDCRKDMDASVEIIAQVGVIIKEFRVLWECVLKVITVIEESKTISWASLNAEEFEDSAKQLVISLRRLPKSLKTSDAFKGLDKIVKEFVITCPIIVSLRSPAMRERHWRELMEVVKKEFTLPSKNPNLLLKDFVEMELHAYANDVEEIADKAQKEAKHEDLLANLTSTWSTINFAMSFYKDTDVPLLRLEEETVEQLESDQMAVQSIVGSRYGYFKKEASEWQKNLGLVSDVTTLLQDIQRTWSYLEPLFIGSEEVKKELPEDAKRFQEVDSQVRAFLQKAWKVRNVKTTCSQNGLLTKLQGLEAKQDQCKKSLSEFLDGKRRQFPRFYFMSEADLLDLLSNSSQPQKVLVHIDKILLSTREIKLDKQGAADRPSGTHFIAGVGKEVVRYDPVVKLQGKAEQYLASLLMAQVYTLSKCLSASMNRYPQLARIDYVMKKDANQEPVDPAQIILLVSLVDFVKQVERAMGNCNNGDARALVKCFDICKAQLAELIQLTQTNLTKGDRQRVMCMVTLDAHNRDICEILLREKALKVTDFQWQSKLRPSFVSDVGKNATIASSAKLSILDAAFDYGFEYLGNGPRLVVTPLTDRIYVTATQALNLKMGCAPAGPAGTGKTETTKDLASSLGKCCYVFNCSPEMDYQSMGNIFKGLAASGSWGCFDEFNRLIPEVLSVCSVQFKAVCDGLKAFNPVNPATHRVTVESDTVNLDSTCGAFITMNPGYLGRSELPEGLKALFRPITVITPDLVLICENMLMAEGFLTAKILASKFYGLYSLLSELLSKQAHYDWGLRAVKSVLVVAGQLKRAEPTLPENVLLMRALRDFNIPKIVQADEVVFFGLLNDLFPGLNPVRVFDEELAECVALACENSGLWPDPFFTLKVMQLDELLDIRHCVFVMGPPGSGKSTSWKMLQAARNHRTPDSKVKVTDINPKTMPTEDLYGYISMATREWKDGLLSSVLRDLGRIPNENPKWIILDGDLDANWIESMNSVMDDNKMLTLASNERIPLKAHMRMIFEIRDLRFATPATVSRAGILYISTDGGSQWRSIIGSWVRSKPESLFEDSDREKVHNMFERYLPDTLRFFATTLKGVIGCNDISLSMSVLRLLDTILTRPIVVDDLSLETAFVFCVIWGFGSVLTISDDGIDYKKMFSDWFRGKLKVVKIPSRDTIFDYWLDPKTCKFDSWKASPAFSEIQFDSNVMNMADVTVPTAETASISYWLDLLVHGGFNVMLAGPAGTGKTQLVNGMLTHLNPENHVFATVNMNFYTSSAVLLNGLEAPLQKRTGSTFGPPGSAKMIYFVDDLNLPQVDNYNTQSAIALIRQHIDYGHWYDTQKLSVKTVDDCRYVSALNPTAGSFSINGRLQRHFTTFAIGMPSASSLLTIYQTFLDGHLLSGGFNQSITMVSSSLIKGALAVHKDVSESFRKTAANFHYEFNIRHLANVFQGLLIAQAQTFIDPEKFVYLWLHESERVYGDRLVDADDLQKFKTIIQNQAKKAFPQYNVNRFYLSGGGVQADLLVFCHFADGVIGQDLTYDKSSKIVDLRATLESALDDYNEVNAAMNLVLFDDAVLHVCRIVRIIKQTGGHCLLVGVGGSGKQSLSRLAAFVCGFNVATIMVNQTYSLLDFRADLQSMFQKAGVKQEGVLFLLTDTQITNEKFMVYLNDLLSSGNIPDLYNRDEKDAIINACSNKAKNAGFSTEPASVWNYFISRIRENLHCCLCFSPVGLGLRTRARRFPALASCTVIDWFQPWPEQALASVGNKLLSDIDLGEAGVVRAVQYFMPTVFVAVNKMCKTFLHAEGKYVYTTPKSYLEMLYLFEKMLASKRASTDEAIFRLKNGVEKLIKAEDDVIMLEKNLNIMLASAEEKRSISEGIATVVLKEKIIVESENAKALVEQEKVAKIQMEVSIKQEDAAKDLEAAEPALMRAMAALDSLDKRDLGNCKTMTKPPPGVDDIFGAVMVLLASVNQNIIVQKTGKVREKERSWDASKKALLGNVNGFLDDLKGFKQHIDEGTVPEINFKEVRPFLVLEHFTPEVIEKRNSAAAGLCSWVINIVNYYDIVLQVEPKRMALRAMNEQLESANTQLETVQARVKDLQEKLDVLTTQYNEAESSRIEAQEIADKGKMKLELANRLTAALGSEKVRWGEGVESLIKERSLLVGDCLIASAFISYIGAFTKKYREMLMEKYLIPLTMKPPDKCGDPIPMTPDMEAIGLMCTDSEVAQYQTQGLPADSVSSENAAIVLNSARYPLMVDPQLQAIYWIKRRCGDQLEIGRLGQKDLIRRILMAVENGKPFLIENMGENVDPTLMPIIGRVSVKRGSKRFLQVGDQEVEISSNFRLYLHTKLSNPHYPPEVQAETALVNFSVTQKGLEEQLLALVVKFERSDLASQRSALILQQNLFLIKVKELENGILRRLAEAKGDITEDRALIEELELSKKISDEIAIKLGESKVTSIKINETSEKYRPVARRGALIFFVMNNLYKMHTYYMFSLTSFVKFFLRGMSTAGNDGEEAETETTEEVEETDLTLLGEAIDRRIAEIEERDKLEEGDKLPDRLKLLKQNITCVVFDFVRTGLFDKDKLTVATLLTLRIMVEDGLLSKIYVDVILRGRAAEENNPRGQELSKWLTEAAWARLKGIEEDLYEYDPVFENLTEKVAADADDWEEWYNNSNPEDIPMPAEYKELGVVPRLLILRVLRPDRLPNALAQYIKTSLGEEFVTQPPFALSSTYKYTSAATPVLFVLFPGVDPTSWVEDYGKTRNITQANGKFANISMGQGQETSADAQIISLSKTGGWIFLQNVHLMQTWLPTLDEKLESLTPHPDFRVFISAEPPPLSYMKNVPEGLLQACICVANEPPSDLKSNLSRSWQTFSQERIDSCEKQSQFKSCLFGLSFFHSIMLGRRRFGCQGWSRAYGFNAGDLKICSDVLEGYLNKKTKIVPYEDLRYIFGEIMYGGHITDFFDRRTNNTYLEVIFNENLLTKGDLCPGLSSPDGVIWDYNMYESLIARSLPAESPVVYGLHPNAEIGFLTSKSENLFDTILRIEVGSSESEEGGGSQMIVRENLQDLVKRTPPLFELFSLADKCKLRITESDGPYCVVVAQECTRFNSLIEEIVKTLEELQKGLNGQLNMSQAMEDISECLEINQVPGRNPFHSCSWEKLAWASKKSLSSWFADLLLRREQLNAWSSTLILPYSIWLPGLLNPTALLTAIKQVTARKNKLPLDNMSLDTHVTRMYQMKEAIALEIFPEDGIFVHGLLMEGARWTDEEESSDSVYQIAGTTCAGHLTESNLKQLLTFMPVMYVKAIEIQPEWSPESVGYLRKDPTLYECPVYLTSARGATFVFLSTLQTVSPIHRWVLAGVALLMQSDD
jgi:dynein heavy chain